MSREGRVAIAELSQRNVLLRTNYYKFIKIHFVPKDACTCCNAQIFGWKEVEKVTVLLRGNE